MTRRELLLSTAAAGAAAAATDASATFTALASNYIRDYLRDSPESATYLGEHAYDHRLSDTTPAGVQQELARDQDLLRRLERIRESDLDPVSRVDARILREHLEGSIWSTTVLRSHEWNPMLYNPGNAVYLLLEREFAPLPERLESVRRRMEAVPEFLKGARQTLKTPTRIHTETAISQTQGTIRLFTATLDPFIEKSSRQTQLKAAQAKAVAALKDWAEYLQSQVLPKASRDFRLGPELYRAKLRHTLDSDLSPEEIRRRAEADLRQTQATMYETARTLAGTQASGLPKHEVIRTVLNRLAEQRPHAETIVEQAKRELADATAFVRSNRIVSVFDSPIRIVEMPEFQRGVAVASCASPGPLEANGITFYNISPPPSSWNEAQVASYFREYNNSMLKNLTVHEAMPGHYLQFAHANRFKAPTPLRAIFWSGTFVEGWAVYAEKVMAEHGYGGPEVRMQQLKMRLRTIINSLLDQAIHARGMSEGQAMDLMLTEGFQEKSEAAGKWKRAMLTSTQLSTYYVGTTELDGLREDWIRKRGPIRDWSSFHDRMLSFGAPAPKHVRTLMGL